MAREQLLDRHRDRLRQMIRYRMDPRLSARVDASDVIQEALVTAHARLSRYLENPQIDFYPWLRRIAWNRLVDMQRHHLMSQRRSVTREAMMAGELSDDSAVCLADRLASTDLLPDQQVLCDELRARVRSALAKLPAVDQDVLALRFLEQLTVRESAQTLGITEGAFKARQLRALHHLRDLLDRNA